VDVFLFHVAILLDAKLRWKENVKKKREEFGLKYQKKNIYWLMGRRSAVSTRNKLVLYRQVLKPVWTCGMQLWGCTRPSNIAIIQRLHTKYSGTSLMHLGMLGMLTSIETSA
jgi:hypothetical protein